MRMIITAAAFLMAIGGAAPIATAQDTAPGAGAKCSLVDDSLARLRCFDDAFPKGAGNAQTLAITEAEAQPSTPETFWQVEASKSAIDDTPMIIASLSPTTSSGTGVGTSQIRLIMRCVENTTSIVVGTTMFMVDETAAVTARVDDAQATTSRWDRSTDYKAVGLWRGSTAIPFVKQLANASRLVLRVQGRDRVDGEFALGNVREAAQQVADACGWEL